MARSYTLLNESNLYGVASVNYPAWVENSGAPLVAYDEAADLPAQVLEVTNVDREERTVTLRNSGTAGMQAAINSVSDQLRGVNPPPVDFAGLEEQVVYRTGPGIWRGSEPQAQQIPRDQTNLRELPPRLHLKKRDGWTAVRNESLGFAGTDSLVVPERTPAQAERSMYTYPSMSRLDFRLVKRTLVEDLRAGTMRKEYWYEEV